MTRQAPVSVNNLPTKAYLETTITPTVLRALSEVTKARPDNPIEFVAYYLLKHISPFQNRIYSYKHLLLRYNSTFYVIFKWRKFIY